MKRWLYDNPWIWIVLFFLLLVTASLITVMIAQYNQPIIVKEKAATEQEAAQP